MSDMENEPQVLESNEEVVDPQSAVVSNESNQDVVQNEEEEEKNEASTEMIPTGAEEVDYGDQKEENDPVVLPTGSNKDGQDEGHEVGVGKDGGEEEPHENVVLDGASRDVLVDEVDKDGVDRKTDVEQDVLPEAHSVGEDAGGGDDKLGSTVEEVEGSSPQAEEKLHKTSVQGMEDGEQELSIPEEDGEEGGEMRGGQDLAGGEEPGEELVELVGSLEEQSPGHKVDESADQGVINPEEEGVEEGTGGSSKESMEVRVEAEKVDMPSEVAARGSDVAEVEPVEEKTGEDSSMVLDGSLPEVPESDLKSQLVGSGEDDFIAVENEQGGLGSEIVMEGEEAEENLDVVPTGLKSRNEDLREKGLDGAAEHEDRGDFEAKGEDDAVRGMGEKEMVSAVEKDDGVDTEVLQDQKSLPTVGSIEEGLIPGNLESLVMESQSRVPPTTQGEPDGLSETNLAGNKEEEGVSGTSPEEEIMEKKNLESLSSVREEDQSDRELLTDLQPVKAPVGVAGEAGSILLNQNSTGSANGLPAFSNTEGNELGEGKTDGLGLKAAAFKVDAMSNPVDKPDGDGEKNEILGLSVHDELKRHQEETQIPHHRIGEGEGGPVGSSSQIDGHANVDGNILDIAGTTPAEPFAAYDLKWSQHNPKERQVTDDPTNQDGLDIKTTAQKEMMPVNPLVDPNRIPKGDPVQNPNQTAPQDAPTRPQLDSMTQLEPAQQSNLQPDSIGGHSSEMYPQINETSRNLNGVHPQDSREVQGQIGLVNSLAKQSSQDRVPIQTDYQAGVTWQPQSSSTGFVTESSPNHRAPETVLNMDPKILDLPDNRQPASFASNLHSTHTEPGSSMISPVLQSEKWPDGPQQMEQPTVSRMPSSGTRARKTWEPSTIISPPFSSIEPNEMNTWHHFDDSQKTRDVHEPAVNPRDTIQDAVNSGSHRLATLPGGVNPGLSMGVLSTENTAKDAATSSVSHLGHGHYSRESSFRERDVMDRIQEGQGRERLPPSHRSYAPSMSFQDTARPFSAFQKTDQYRERHEGRNLSAAVHGYPGLDMNKTRNSPDSSLRLLGSSGRRLCQRPQTAHSILAAAGSGTKAVRERLRNAIKRESTVRMQAEMSAMDVEDLKLEKEIAHLTAEEEVNVREELQQELQRAYAEIERLKLENAWELLNDEQRRSQALSSQVSALRCEVSTLKRTLDQEYEKRQSIEKSLQEERKQWIACIGNLSQPQPPAASPSVPSQPQMPSHDDSLQRDMAELKATMHEANRNTVELLQSSNRFGSSSYGQGHRSLAYVPPTMGVPKYKRPRYPQNASHASSYDAWGEWGEQQTLHKNKSGSPSQIEAYCQTANRPVSPSARMHNVIAQMDAAPQLQAVHGKQDEGQKNPVDIPVERSHQGASSRYMQGPLHNSTASNIQSTPGNFQRDQSVAMPQPPPKGLSHELLSPQVARKGRRILEYREPIPPTKMCPSELSKARMEYIQDVKRIRGDVVSRMNPRTGA